jgi:hypothetical protein
MGWFGTAILAALIGMAGWRFHPSGPLSLRSRVRSDGLTSDPSARVVGSRAQSLRDMLAAAGVAAIAALVVKLAGNASGAFSDGQFLEWLATVLAAITAVAVLGRLCAGRRLDRRGL